jgi:hypothetical protein
MLIKDLQRKLLDCCTQFSNEFSTEDLIKEFATKYPADWALIQQKYGVGGKGNGSHYTSYVYIALMLSRISKKGKIKFEGYKEAPENWGNEDIACWSNT